jgi:hypothetical protein
MCLQFGFVILGQKDFGAKAAHKMLVKLTRDIVIKLFSLSLTEGKNKLERTALKNFY